MTVAKPDIVALGVNVSSDTIAIKLPSLNNLVIFCVTSDESAIESNVNPFVFQI